MYLNITASKDTYIHNKILNNSYRASDSNVGSAGTLDLFKLYAESELPPAEAKNESELVSVTFPSHNTTSENLSSKYFFLFDQNNVKYYVWFNVDGLSPDPSIVNASGIEVNVSSGDSAAIIASKSTTAISTTSTFSVFDKGTGEIEITVIEPGPVLNASNGNITDEVFDLVILVKGNKPGMFNLDTDGDGIPETAIELSRLLLNFDLSILSTYDTFDVTNPDFRATLRLYDILDGQVTPANFSIEIFPLAVEFSEGIGKDTGYFSDLDICNFVTASYVGSPVLWNKPGADSKGNVGDLGVDVYCSSSLGAEQLYVSKEFVGGNEEFSFDVTEIVKKMLDGVSGVPQHGFRISFSESQEKDDKSYFIKRFASRNVLNQYLRPRLSISWDDSIIDNSKDAIFDSENSLIFQNTSRGTPTYATDYEIIVGGQSQLSLMLSTGSWSQTYPAPRLMANGDSEKQIEGIYTTSFSIDILDGATPRVVSSQSEIVRIKLSDGDNMLGKYFTITNNEFPTTSYDFWFGLDADVVPIDIINTPVKITINSNETADSIAPIVATTINDETSGLTASVFSLGVVHVSFATAGTPDIIANAGTIIAEDFSVSRYREGNIVTLQDHIFASGSISFTTKWFGNSTPDGSGEEVTLHSGTITINQSDRSSFNAIRKNVLFTVLNVKKSYKSRERAKFRVFARDYNKLLVPSKIAVKIDPVIFDKAYYRIKDAISGDIIIPFEYENNGTRMSTDSEGMYFNIDMSSLFPGRTYTLDVLVIADGDEIVYECNGTRFKVEP